MNGLFFIGDYYITNSIKKHSKRIAYTIIALTIVLILVIILFFTTPKAESYSENNSYKYTIVT